MADVEPKIEEQDRADAAANTPPVLKRPAARDRLRSIRKQPNWRLIPVVFDSSLAARIDEAKHTLSLAKMTADLRVNDESAAVDLEAAEAALAEARVNAGEGVMRFLIRASGRQAYDDLLNDYPPTGEQRKDAQKRGLEKPQYDHETFPPALIAASVVWMGDATETAPTEEDPPVLPTEPIFTFEDVRDMIWDDERWSTAEATVLFLASVEVNTGRRLVDLGKG